MQMTDNIGANGIAVGGFFISQATCAHHAHAAHLAHESSLACIGPIRYDLSMLQCGTACFLL